MALQARCFASTSLLKTNAIRELDKLSIAYGLRDFAERGCVRSTTRSPRRIINPWDAESAAAGPLDTAALRIED
jgi:hypothetical protein